MNVKELQKFEDCKKFKQHLDRIYSTQFYRQNEISNKKNKQGELTNKFVRDSSTPATQTRLFKIFIYKLVDYVVSKRKNLISLISQFAEIKERNVFKDVSSAPDFTPEDQECHLTVYLKTFYELKRDETGRPLVNCSLNQKEKWEIMHLYLRVLKRYYTLINLLTEAARVLKTSAHILT